MTIPLACALCFFAGFGFGVTFADGIRLLLTTWRRPHVPNSPLPRRTAMRIFWAMLVGLLMTGIMCAVSWTRAVDAEHDAQRTTQRFQRYVACQARYQQGFAESYRARVEPAASVFSALDRVIFDVSAKNVGDFYPAIKHYLAVRHHQTTAIHDNPPPALPKTVCGAPPEG